MTIDNQKAIHTLEEAKAVPSSTKYYALRYAVVPLLQQEPVGVSRLLAWAGDN